MKELVEVIAKALVDHPEEVSVNEKKEGRTTVLELHVADSDMRVADPQGSEGRGGAQGDRDGQAPLLPILGQIGIVVIDPERGEVEEVPCMRRASSRSTSIMRVIVAASALPASSLPRLTSEFGVSGERARTLRAGGVSSARSAGRGVVTVIVSTSSSGCAGCSGPGSHCRCCRTGYRHVERGSILPTCVR